MKRYFITGVGTDIGKTFFTCALAWQLREKGKTVRAIKPVVSGYKPGESDTDELLKVQGLTESDLISPWRFAAAISPDLAARSENRTIDFAALADFCKAGAEDYQLVEGAGGVMTPITEQHTNRDWIKALSIPVVLVTGTYLGALSHTLTAAESLYAKNLAIAAIVINASETAAISNEKMRESLERFLPLPMITLNRLDYGAEMWKTVPDITSMFI